MGIKRKSELLSVTVDMQPKISFEAEFATGAWDDEAKAWVGAHTPEIVAMDVLSPESKKQLNDVLGVVVTKALEETKTARAQADVNRALLEGAELAATKLREELTNALGARDNFAALEKKARGDLLNAENAKAIYVRGLADRSDKLDKIPRLIRRLFGAI